MERIIATKATFSNRSSAICETYLFDPCDFGGCVDSERMLLRVERGKGGKDRHARERLG